ncbi:hypothetical protein HPC49_34595 [Pyxidicoccus fallax]|uniref:Uncharacterized protein n=1 Tax=Pyxidicoccus fallax TaxID=394095 RepID=A0A848LEX0_9BACT|nr:hypothetical protein [Pyxidicoccus fallax]NMO17046.1 hypothetical protein [Pyxidicoccus fallax]NPC83339.1 hypothetical protein [Pyxidicoccus fallax]
MALTEVFRNPSIRRVRGALLLGCLLAPLAARADDSLLEALFIEVEAGPLKVFRNELGFGAGGTRYSAEDINQDEPLFNTKRASVEARLGERHGVVLLYAPLPITTRATLTKDILFKDTLFPAGTPVEHTYSFSGYRASYVYRLINGERFQWDVGVSLQIRTALVELRSQDGGLYARDADIGPVPALKTRLTWWPSKRLWAALEVDGLVNPTDPSGGALYDAALTLGVPLDDDAAVSPYLRLRFYGGGVDNTDSDSPIYNFANLGFALLGVRADVVELLD